MYHIARDIDPTVFVVLIDRKRGCREIWIGESPDWDGGDTCPAFNGIGECGAAGGAELVGQFAPTVGGCDPLV